MSETDSGAGFSRQASPDAAEMTLETTLQTRAHAGLLESPDGCGSGERERLHLTVEVSAVAQAETRAGPGLVVLVVDTSGSMSGQVELVREAMTAVREAHAAGSLAVVLFCHEARVALAPTPTAALTPELWAAVLQDVNACGGTSIANALEATTE